MGLIVSNVLSYVPRQLSFAALAQLSQVQLSFRPENHKNGKMNLSAGQANLPGKQQSHDGEEYGQNEQHIGGAHHCIVGELIRLSSNFVDVETDWEYEGGHTEEDHACEGDPSGITGGLTMPAGHHQQTTGGSEGNDTQDDKEEGGDPLWRQLWWDAGPVPAMDGLALTDQTHHQRAR